MAPSAPDDPALGTGLEAAGGLKAARRRTSERAAGLRHDLDAVIEAAALTPPDDEHDPEGATVGFERALLSQLLDQALAQLADLDHAIARLGSGAYGGCDGCGRPISPERLAAHPTARTCVACASRAARPPLRRRD